MKIRHSLSPIPLGALFCTLAWGQAYKINIGAGNGTSGFTGDAGAAPSAELTIPGGLAIASGKIYIADTGNNRIRVISGGTISTLAGNGTAGYSGDTAAATAAELNTPSGVAVDSSGNVYVADTANHVVREISTSGTITTIAGNNVSGEGYSGDGGTATDAQLAFPTAVAVDSSGNVYIADSGNDAIREVTGGNISTVVGGDAVGYLYHPNGIIFDSSGHLYIADTGNQRVVEFVNGALTLVAGNGGDGFSGDNGLAINAEMSDPTGIGFDSHGNLYIADTANCRIRVVSGGIITTIAGNGTPGYGTEGGLALNTQLYFPHDVKVDPTGIIYIADSDSNRVLTLQAPAPAIATNGAVNAASFTAKLSPGSLATVFGTNITGASASAASLPLGTNLGGVSVTVNGKAAPVLYVSATQINFQVPWETATGSATVVVSVNGEATNQITVPVVAAAPGLFLQSSGAAVVENQDTTLNTGSNAAAAGSTITAYLTGSGPVSPAVADGAAASSSSLALLTSQYSVTIGSQTAQVTFAGLAPDFVGLAQLNIVVPSGLTPGNYPLTITINGVASNSAQISVK